MDMSGNVQGPLRHAGQLYIHAGRWSANRLAYIVLGSGLAPAVPPVHPPVRDGLAIFKVVHLGDVLVEPPAPEAVPHRQHRVPQPLLHCLGIQNFVYVAILVLPQTFFDLVNQSIFSSFVP